MGRIIIAILFVFAFTTQSIAQDMLEFKVNEGISLKTEVGRIMSGNSNFSTKILKVRNGYLYTQIFIWQGQSFASTRVEMTTTFVPENFVLENKN